jgi:hypothetical protein
MDREAEIAVKKAVGTRPPNYMIDVKQIGEQVLATCSARFSNGIAVQDRDRQSAELRATDALNALMKSDIEKQRRAKRERDLGYEALDARKLTAESNEALQRYGQCLHSHVDTLAVNSTEPAEVIARAAFASCQDERRSILEIHRQYHDTLFDDELLEAIDKRVADSLLLEVIKARASRQPAQPNAGPDKAI